MIVVVGDVEARLQSDLGSEFAEHLGAKSVNRSALHTLGARAQLSLQPHCDLARSPVRERKDADSFRIETALLDEKPDALDQAESLAGAGTGENQYWMRRRLDGLTLR